jgi:predicted transcriptional regulator
MQSKKLTAAELKIMDALWEKGPASIRELLEAYGGKKPPGYTTVQTLVYRLEQKGAIRRTRKIGGAHIFEAVISRNAAQRKMFDDFLKLFGGRAQPLISHLIETGEMTREDIEAAKRQLESKRAAKSARSAKNET